jgi:hypothetical protein
MSGPLLGEPTLAGRGESAAFREVLVLGGWITLLIACVEHDPGNRPAAETTRRGALSLGEEADHGEIQGWASLPCPICGPARRGPAARSFGISSSCVSRGFCAEW